MKTVRQRICDRLAARLGAVEQKFDEKFPANKYNPFYQLVWFEQRRKALKEMLEPNTTFCEAIRIAVTFVKELRAYDVILAKPQK